MRRVVLYKHGGGFDREVRVGGRIVDGNEREATKNLDGAESAFDPPFGPYNTNTLWLVTGARFPVEPARACYPYAPPALFTGTGALYDTPTSTARLPSAPVEGGMTQGGEPTERRLGGSAAQ